MRLFINGTKYKIFPNLERQEVRNTSYILQVPIAADERLTVSAVIQIAFIEVNVEGSEAAAAAATADIMTISRPRSSSTTDHSCS